MAFKSKHPAIGSSPFYRAQAAWSNEVEEKIAALEARLDALESPKPRQRKPKEPLIELAEEGTGE